MVFVSLAPLVLSWHRETLQPKSPNQQHGTAQDALLCCTAVLLSPCLLPLSPTRTLRAPTASGSGPPTQPALLGGAEPKGTGSELAVSLAVQALLTQPAACLVVSPTASAATARIAKEWQSKRLSLRKKQERCRAPPCYMNSPFIGGMAMACFSEWQHSFSGLHGNVLSSNPVFTPGAAPPGDALF